MGRRKKRYKSRKNESTLGAFIFIIFIFLILMSQYTQKNNPLNKIKEEKATILEAEGELHIYYFDVGQADSELIINEGQTMLIDAGNNEDGEMLVQKIKDLGITKIDHLIGTHAHEDHIGGMDDIIENFEIGEVYLPEAISTSKTYEEVLDAIAKKELSITVSEIGDEIIVGTAVGTVKSIGNDDDDLNASSIVLRLVYGENSFLFMGDLEQNMEVKYTWEETDVLKVGHHGSNTSSSKDFLNQVLPKYAIIPVGEGNTYNHPGEYALERLNNLNTKIYRTDKNGTVNLVSDGVNINITTEK